MSLRCTRSRPPAIPLHNALTPAPTGAILPIENSSSGGSSNALCTLTDKPPEIQVDALVRALRRALQDRTKFDVETRAYVRDGSRDPELVSYVLLVRGLVIGPAANVDLWDCVPVESKQAFVLSLASHRLEDTVTDNKLERLCGVLVFGPIVVGRDPVMALVRIAAEARGYDDSDFREQYRTSADPQVLQQIQRVVMVCDRNLLEFTVQYVLDFASDGAIQLGLALLHRQDVPTDIMELLVDKMGHGAVEAQRSLLSLARDRCVPPSIRRRLIEVCLREAKGNYVTEIAGLASDADGGIRSSLVMGLSCSPDLLLDDALECAMRVIAAEKDVATRARMIKEFASNNRQIEKRAGLVEGFAMSDSSATCRLAALDGLTLGEYPNLSVLASRMSTADADCDVRARARTILEKVLKR